MLDVTASYGASFILLCFFGYIFIHLITLSSPYFHRLCVSFWNVNIPNMSAGNFGRLFYLIAFLGILVYFDIFHVSDKSKKYLSVGYYVILSVFVVVVCRLSSMFSLQPTPAYVEV